MKHVQAISRRPAKAQDVTAGQILTVIVSLLDVIAQALVAKESAS